jgi:hypothetical protein
MCGARSPAKPGYSRSDAVGRNCFIAPLRTSPEVDVDFERQRRNKAIAPYTLRPFWNQPLPFRLSRCPRIERGIVGGQLLAVAIDPDRCGAR